MSAAPLRVFVWPPAAGWGPLPSPCTGCLTVEARPPRRPRMRTRS